MITSRLPSAFAALILLTAIPFASAQDSGSGVLMDEGALGWVASVLNFNPANPPEITVEMTYPPGRPDLAGLNLEGQPSITSTDLLGIWSLSDVVLILNVAGRLAIQAKFGIGLGVSGREIYGSYVATALNLYSLGQGLAPTPSGVTPGSDLPLGALPGPNDIRTPFPRADVSIGQLLAIFYFSGSTAKATAPSADTHGIGMVTEDSASIVIQAGDAVPDRPVSPPNGTGTTFTTIDGGWLSINAGYALFKASGDLFNGIYARRIADGSLFAAIENFVFQQGDLGLIGGASLFGERGVLFDADAGIYTADVEGATPPELKLAKNTEYEPGKVFVTGLVQDVTGNQAVISGLGEGAKSTIFLLNLDDWSVQQIVQQGEAAPGGGTFSVVSRPGVSDTMVVFEGFDENFQFLGLFAYLLETKELRAVARVGEIFDGKEVRTVTYQPGALHGSVLGFTVYFTDNSAGAYLTTSKVSFTVPFGNLSTRLAVGTDDAAGIGGFINTLRPDIQTAPLNLGAKQVVIRAIGPSLGAFGVAGPLADPVLELHDATGALITSNDNWRDTQEQEIIDAGLAPTDDLESAILTTLELGAYTAIVRGSNGSTGVGLVEIYDLDGAAVSELGNISTRGSVQTGDGVMIGGFIVGGTESTASTMVVRAIGPSLTAFGVADALQDPTLELHDGSGALIASNDNWKDTQQTELEAAGLAPTDDREAALEVALGPGLYTAIVRGAGETTGVALVEAYNLEASAAPVALPVSLTNRR